MINLLTEIRDVYRKRQIHVEFKQIVPNIKIIEDYLSTDAVKFIHSQYFVVALD